LLTDVNKMVQGEDKIDPLFLVVKRKLIDIGFRGWFSLGYLEILFMDGFSLSGFRILDANRRQSTFNKYRCTHWCGQEK